MPTAKKLPSGSWRCQVYSHTKDVYQPDGTVKKKRIYESFTCDIPGPKGKRLAEQMAADFAAKKEQHELLYEKLTLNEALEKYIEIKSNVLSPATIRGYRTLQKNSYKSLASTRLRDINSVKVQTWVNQFSVGHSPKTVSNAHGLLSAVMNLYMPQVRLTVKLPMSKRPNLYTPSDSDVKALLEHIEGTDMEIAVLLAAFGAMRRGEICALTDKDISGNFVTINKAVVRGTKGMVTKSPKTTSSYRTVELPDFVIQRISGIEGRIIKMHPEDISKNFGKILESIGLPAFRFHDLRHYAASIMHALGIPDQYIMEIGGWKSDRVLKSVYRNVIEDEKKKFTNKINAHFEDMQHDMQHEKQKTP